MQTPTDALVSHEASIDIQASPDQLYAMISDIGRMGEWSPESTGGEWIRGGGGQVGDWFSGTNNNGEREWSRECEVACADPGRDFTFVVGGVEANCTWWSYEMEPTATGTRLTERWWLVNKTPAAAAATPEQFDARVAFTKTMIDDTLAAIKDAAEA